MVKRLMAIMVLVAALAAVGIAGAATPASAKRAATACAGKAHAEQAAVRALSVRRPVAMVPGLRYDPRTMTPRGICHAPGPAVTGV